MNEFSKFLEDYPWGDYSDVYVDAVYWIVENKDKLLKFDYPFDYDDYWGMPEKFCNELSPDEVDWIQNCTYDWWN
jgi:hypothetical protein